MEFGRDGPPALVRPWGVMVLLRRILWCCAVLVPVAVHAEPAVIKVFEARVYAAPDRSSAVLATLVEATSVSVSELPDGAFRKVRLANGTVGYVEESALRFPEGAAASSAAQPPVPPPPPGAPFPSPARPPDVVHLVDGSIVVGTIVAEVPGVSVTVRYPDGGTIVLPVPSIASIAKEGVEGPVRTYVVVPSEKSPGLAWFLSFIFPGGGQYYNGEVAKGAIMTGVYVGGLALAIAGASQMASSCPYYGPCNSAPVNPMVWIGVVAMTGSWVWSMIDAPISAGEYNERMARRAPSFGHAFERSLGTTVVALDVGTTARGGASGQLHPSLLGSPADGPCVAPGWTRRVARPGDWESEERGRAGVGGSLAAGLPGGLD